MLARLLLAAAAGFAATAGAQAPSRLRASTLQDDRVLGAASNDRSDRQAIVTWYEGEDGAAGCTGRSTRQAVQGTGCVEGVGPGGLAVGWKVQCEKGLNGGVFSFCGSPSCTPSSCATVSAFTDRGCLSNPFSSVAGGVNAILSGLIGQASSVSVRCVWEAESEEGSNATGAPRPSQRLATPSPVPNLGLESSPGAGTPSEEDRPSPGIGPRSPSPIGPLFSSPGAEPAGPTLGAGANDAAFWGLSLSAQSWDRASRGELGPCGAGQTVLALTGVSGTCTRLSAALEQGAGLAMQVQDLVRTSLGPAAIGGVSASDSLLLVQGLVSSFPPSTFSLTGIASDLSAVQGVLPGVQRAALILADAALMQTLVSDSPTTLAQLQPRLETAVSGEGLPQVDLASLLLQQGGDLPQSLVVECDEDLRGGRLLGCSDSECGECTVVAAFVNGTCLPAARLSTGGDGTLRTADRAYVIDVEAVCAAQRPPIVIPSLPSSSLSAPTLPSAVPTHSAASALLDTHVVWKAKVSSGHAQNPCTGPALWTLHGNDGMCLSVHAALAQAEALAQQAAESAQEIDALDLTGVNAAQAAAEAVAILDAAMSAGIGPVEALGGVQGALQLATFLLPRLADQSGLQPEQVAALIAIAETSASEPSLTVQGIANVLRTALAALRSSINNEGMVVPAGLLVQCGHPKGHDTFGGSLLACTDDSCSASTCTSFARFKPHKCLSIQGDAKWDGLGVLGDGQVEGALDVSLTCKLKKIKPTSTPSPLPSPSASASEEPSPSPSASASDEPSPLPSPSASASEEPSPSPSASASEEPSPSPSASASEEPSPSPSASASEEPSPSPSASASEEPSPSPSASASEEPSPSPSASASEEPSPSPSAPASEVPSPSPSPEASLGLAPLPPVLPASPSPAVTVRPSSKPSKSPRPPQHSASVKPSTKVTQPSATPKSSKKPKPAKIDRYQSSTSQPQEESSSSSGTLVNQEEEPAMVVDQSTTSDSEAKGSSSSSDDSDEYSDSLRPRRHRKWKAYSPSRWCPPRHVKWCFDVPSRMWVKDEQWQRSGHRALTGTGQGGASGACHFGRGIAPRWKCVRK